MLLSSILHVLIFATYTTAAVVTGIFTNYNSIKYVDGGGYGSSAPLNPSWVSEFAWHLDGSKVNPGDTFSLIMSCTYKFTSTLTTVNLVAGGVTYATCNLNAG